MFAGTRTRACIACIAILAAAAAVSIGRAELAAQVSPTVTVSPLSVAPGGTITATIANGPGNARDWVALYSGLSLIDWKYLNGTRTAPTTGVTSATVTFVMPTTPGTYTVQLLANDTYVVLAASAVITVQNNNPTPTISATPTTVTGGGDVTVTVANGPANARDWVALYAGSTLVDWKYLNGSQTAPAAG